MYRSGGVLPGETEAIYRLMSEELPALRPGLAQVIPMDTTEATLWYQGCIRRVPRHPVMSWAGPATPTDPPARNQVHPHLPNPPGSLNRICTPRHMIIGMVRSRPRRIPNPWRSLRSPGAAPSLSAVRSGDAPGPHRTKRYERFAAVLVTRPLELNLA